MCLAHACAWAVSSPCTWRGANARLARVPLKPATKAPGYAPRDEAVVPVRPAKARATARRAAAARERPDRRRDVAATQSHRPPPGCLECDLLARLLAREP